MRRLIVAFMLVAVSGTVTSSAPAIWLATSSSPAAQEIRQNHVADTEDMVDPNVVDIEMRETSCLAMY